VYIKIMEMLCNMLRENEEHQLDHKAVLHRIKMIQELHNDTSMYVSTFKDSAGYNESYPHFQSPVPTTRNLNRCHNKPRKKTRRHQLDHKVALHRIKMIQPPPSEMYIDVSITKDLAGYNESYPHLQSPVPTTRNLNSCHKNPQKRTHVGRGPYSPPNTVDPGI
jgi:hypothetical protein